MLTHSHLPESTYKSCRKYANVFTWTHLLADDVVISKFLIAFSDKISFLKKQLVFIRDFLSLL